MDGFQGFADTPNFRSPLVEFKDVGGGMMGFNLSHLLPRDRPPPSKTPPLSLCLSGSGTVMLILGLILPSKLRGLQY